MLWDSRSYLNLYIFFFLCLLLTLLQEGEKGTPSSLPGEGRSPGFPVGLCWHWRSGLLLLRGAGGPPTRPPLTPPWLGRTELLTTAPQMAPTDILVGCGGPHYCWGPWKSRLPISLLWHRPSVCVCQGGGALLLPGMGGSPGPWLLFSDLIICGGGESWLSMKAFRKAIWQRGLAPC